MLDSVPQNIPLFVFRHYSNDQFILALDNINIISNDLKQREVFKPSFRVYPNPSNGIVNIDIKGTENTFKYTTL